MEALLEYPEPQQKRQLTQYKRILEDLETHLRERYRLEGEEVVRIEELENLIESFKRERLW